MGSDRTNEFFTTIKLMENKPQYINSELRQRKLAAAGASASAAAHNTVANQQYSRFMLGAKSISKELCLTYQKLEHLHELARRRTMFDAEDTNRQLNELVYIIKQNINSLNSQIEQLRMNQVNGGYLYASKNIESHSKNVVLNLQQRLASMSSDFKSALELRSQNMAQQRLREQQFSKSGSNGSDFASASNGHQQPSGNPYSSQVMKPLNQITNRSNTVIDFGDGSSGTHDQQQQMQLEPQQQQQLQQQKQASLFDTTNEYLEERANTMQSIESTIVELGTIFNQLATMVQHQEEMITRIDSNVNDASLNVEAAHESLLRYFNTISNNRWLMLKVFGVLFAFFMLFVMFA